MKSILKSIWNAIKSHPHICVIFLTALLITVLGIPFYYFFVVIGIYFIAMYLIHLPTYAGNTGYFLERLTGRRKPALPWYRFAYRHRTKSEYALVSYGLYLLEECQYEEALHLFQYLFTLPSIEPTVKKFAYQDLSIAQWKCGDLPGAIATLEQMLTDYEYFNLPFYTTLGFYYIEAGDYEKARFYTNKALEMDEAHGPAYDNLGQLAFRQEDYDEAEAMFRKALDLKSDMADSKYYLGRIAEIKGDSEMAAAFYHAAARSRITGMNTVSREEVDKKSQAYS